MKFLHPTLLALFVALCFVLHNNYSHALVPMKISSKATTTVIKTSNNKYCISDAVFPGTTICLANATESKALLTRNDDFFKVITQFDIDGRMMLSSSFNATLDLFKNYLSNQVEEFNDNDFSKVKSACQLVKRGFANTPKLTGYKLPKIIYIVKTTGRDEGGATYTRGLDTIVFPDEIFSSSPKSLASYIGSKIFHLFTKNNPTLRDDLYKLINFYPTGNEVSRPKTIEKQVITNPDCPTYSHYIELTIGPGKTYKFIPVLYSDTPYNNGGLFFEYMNYGMYAIEKDYNTGNYVPKIDPVTKDYIFIDPHDYQEYFVKIGENASEDTHPEMIIGASFMDVYNIPTLDLLIKLKQQLS